MSSNTSIEIQLQISSSSPDDDDARVAGAPPQVAIPANGTTSLAFLIKEGIILASYSHMIMKIDTSRIMEINPYTLCKMVGDPVDQLFWIQCELYKTQNKRVLPIDIASALLHDMMEYHSEMGLSAEALIAGWEGESPVLYYVDKDHIAYESVPKFGIGHGKQCLNHLMNVGYDYDMSICEAASFARWAIDRAAGHRVASSVYYVGPHGWKKILGDDVKFPSSDIMNIEDQETPVKKWQAHLKFIEKLEYKTSLARLAVVHASDVHGFKKIEARTL